MIPSKRKVKMENVERESVILIKKMSSFVCTFSSVHLFKNNLNYHGITGKS